MRNTKELIAKVKELKTPNTVVYICPDNFDVNFAYYYNKQLFKNIDPTSNKRVMYEWFAKENIYAIASYKQIDTSLIEKADKVLYLDGAADFSYHGNNVKAFLDKKMTVTQHHYFFQIFYLYEYKKSKK